MVGLFEQFDSQKISHLADCLQSLTTKEYAIWWTVCRVHETFMTDPAILSSCRA